MNKNTLYIRLDLCIYFAVEHGNISHLPFALDWALQFMFIQFGFLLQMANSFKSLTFIQSLSTDLSEALIRVRTFKEQPYMIWLYATV